jgi:uncharacterized membrane protein YfcA
MTFAALGYAELLLIAATALGAQVVGGLAGYGTGLIMPLVLVPLIGAEAVVPVIALASLITNPTRVAAFRAALDCRKAAIVTLTALPTVGLGAWAFTWLSGRGASILIGLMLVVLVPLRRGLKQRAFRLSEPGLGITGLGFGFVMGGTTGSGVVLLSMLMAAGLTGSQVIATDAAISFLLGIVKTGVFAGAGALPPSLWLLALLIGLMATPGTLLAKWLAQRFSAHIHDLIIEVAIMAGAVILIAQAVGG